MSTWRTWWEMCLALWAQRQIKQSPKQRVVFLPTCFGQNRALLEPGPQSPGSPRDHGAGGGGACEQSLCKGPSGVDRQPLMSGVPHKHESES